MVLKILFALFIFLVSFQTLANETVVDDERFYINPIYKKIGSSKKLIGLEIVTEDSDMAKLREINGFTHLPFASNSLNKYRKLFLAMGLHPVGLVNGKYIGTIKKYRSIAYTKKTGAGFSINFFGLGFNLADLANNDDDMEEDELILGSKSFWGLELFPYSGRGDITETGGFSISDPITEIINAGKSLLKTQSPLEIKQELVKFAAAIPKSPKSNQSPDWLDLPIIKNKDLRLEEKTPKKENISESWLSELNWKYRFNLMNQQAPLWNNLNAQKFVQNLCSQIASHTTIPDEIAPRCRIFASLSPSAFSYAGGDVFITGGLIGSLKHIDTLIFFLAHETGHVYHKHTTALLNTEDHIEKFYNTLSLLSSLYTKNFLQSAALVNTTKHFLADNQADGTTSILYGLTRLNQSQHEDEADQFAIHICQKMGCDFKKIEKDLSSLQLDMDQLQSMKATPPSTHHLKYKTFDQRISAEPTGPAQALDQDFYFQLHSTLNPSYQGYRIYLLSL